MSSIACVYKRCKKVVVVVVVVVAVVVVVVVVIVVVVYSAVSHNCTINRITT